MTALHDRIVACRKCQRLNAWCETVAREKRAAYQHETYWGKPVPSFGDPDARLVIVGLAPGAHGANRTGRMFTGDRSGDFLYAALHRAGFASQPESRSRDDGQQLTDCAITAVVHCAPPGNRPATDERDRCVEYLTEEIGLLARAKVFLCLGGFAWDGTQLALSKRGIVPVKQVKFGHGAETTAGPYHLLASYHVSQQNTFTGRLTPGMLDGILQRARCLIA